VLTGESVNGIPSIAQRALKSNTSLPFGEWAVVAGLLSPQEARAITGVAGLERIPVLGQLLKSHTNSDGDARVLILIRPTLLTPPPVLSPSVFVGTFNKPVTPM
jgi:Flp pilus assembly secretin CpaC